MSAKDIPVDEETIREILSELEGKRGDMDYYTRQIEILKEYPDIISFIDKEAVMSASHILGDLPEGMADQLVKQAHLTFVPRLRGMFYMGYILTKKIYESQK